MKILFLDHDCVLSLDAPESEMAIPKANPWNCRPFLKKAVDALNRVIKETDCEIVVSSDWRLSYSLGDMRDIYTEHGIQKVPIAFTGKVTLPMVDYMSEDISSPNTVFYERKLEEERYQEIAIWRSQHKIIDRYCIVDDMPLFDSEHEQNHFVHVDYRQGIVQKGKVETIIKILNQDD